MYKRQVKTEKYARFKAKHQDKAEAEAERRIEMCKRVVKKMLRHQLSMAWNEFVECVLTTKENRETVRRVLARMQHRQLAGAFDCFAGAVETIVAQRDQIAKSVVKWRAPGVKRAVDRWLEYMDMMAQERAEEAQELERGRLEGWGRLQQANAQLDERYEDDQPVDDVEHAGSKVCKSPPAQLDGLFAREAC